MQDLNFILETFLFRNCLHSLKKKTDNAYEDTHFNIILCVQIPCK